MKLSEQYSKQYNWRSWDKIYCKLPTLAGKKVLDVGCAIGDQSQDFSDMGALVTGIDGNQELLAVAKSRNIANSQFIKADFGNMDMLQEEKYDLIWSSFSIAYFMDQSKIINYWKSFLKDGGFLCLIEMSDLLGHEPLANKYKKQVEKFYKDAFAEQRYDFLAGEKLEKSMISGGFEIIAAENIADKELSFSGEAPEEIRKAWFQRFERPKMKEDLPLGLAEAFLETINRKDHKSNCVVKFVLGKKL
ncbi:MAG: class I SAM-dependent methyltransferase [Alphaproteobacteria bacterium]